MVAGLKINNQWLHMAPGFAPKLKRHNSVFNPGKILGIFSFDIEIPIQGNESLLDFEHLIELPNNFVAIDDVELWLHGRQYLGRLIFHRNEVDKDSSVLYTDFTSTTFPIGLDEMLINELDLPTYNLGDSPNSRFAAAKTHNDNDYSPFRFPVYRNDAFYTKSENPFLFLNSDGTAKEDPAVFINDYDGGNDEFAENEYNPTNYISHAHRTVWENKTTLVPWFHFFEVLKAIIESIGYTPIGDFFQNPKQPANQVLICNNYSVGNVDPDWAIDFAGNYEFHEYNTNDYLTAISAASWQSQYDAWMNPESPEYPPYYILKFTEFNGIFHNNLGQFDQTIGEKIMVMGNAGLAINLTVRANVFNMEQTGAPPTPTSGTIQFIVEVWANGTTLHTTLTFDAAAGADMNLITAHFYSEINLPNNSYITLRFLMPKILTSNNVSAMVVIRDYFCEAISLELATDVNDYHAPDDIKMKNHLPEMSVSQFLVNAKDLFGLDISADVAKKTIRCDYAKNQIQRHAINIEKLLVSKIAKTYNPEATLHFKFKIAGEIEEEPPKSFLGIDSELVGEFNWKSVPDGTYLFNELNRRFFILTNLDMTGSDWVPTLEPVDLGTKPVNYSLGNGESTITIQPTFNPVPLDYTSKPMAAKSQSAFLSDAKVLVPVLDQYGSKAATGILGANADPLLAVWHGMSHAPVIANEYPFASSFTKNSQNIEFERPPIGIMWNEPDRGLFDLYWKDIAEVMLNTSEFEVSIVGSKTEIDAIFENKKVYFHGQNYLIAEQEEEPYNNQVIAHLTLKRINAT